MNFENDKNQKKPLKKITKTRLKNIGLYYLERFESSAQNLKQVLKRRVDRYAYQNPDFNKIEAYEWIEEITKEFENFNYINDERYALMKIKDYILRGKPERYILSKLKSKGIDETTVQHFLSEQNVDEYDLALKFALKKKIGPYRSDIDIQKQMRQKDMATLIRAGFSYDVVCRVLDSTLEDNI